MVGEAFREDWDALQQARSVDPSATEVRERADALLARRPPIGIFVGALAAKAEQAWRVGDDAAAIEAADAALDALEPMPSPPPAVAVELAVTRLRALVRGGDPARAARALNDPLVTGANLAETERLGLRALALDRDAQYVLALVAYARWREAVPAESPEAVYAEQRLQGLADAVDPEHLRSAVAELPEGPARECLHRQLGVGGSKPEAAWVAGCGRDAVLLGVALPRSGKLSALADPQLGAMSVALPLLLPQGQVPGLLFEDAGSTPEEAARAVRALGRKGVRVIVGPIGAANVQSAAAAAGPGVRLVVPAEGTGDVVGVAPSLEARVQALVTRARDLGARRFVVAAPANPYGRRAVAALRAAATPAEQARMIVQTYAPETTSFAPIVAPLLPALRDGAAVFVPDHVSRAELVVRQLVRSGEPLRRPGSGGGVIVLSTAEGISEESLGPGHDILAGLWVAPVAVPTADAEPFSLAYRAAQGEAPPDQALLVFYALRRALLGIPGPQATALVVEEGRLALPSSSL